MDDLPDPGGGGESPERSARTARRHAAATWGIVLLGTILRLRQYFSGRSLWLDETLLALNLMRRTALELLRPLDHHQYAPIGFLWLERMAVVLFGAGELALRLVPLLAGIAALALLAVIARRVASPDAALAALGLFALSGPAVYYAAEVKQYSSDALVAVALLALTLPGLSDPPDRRRMALLAAGGAIAIWFSHPAVFVLGAAGIALAAACVRAGDAGALARTLGAVAVWLASFAASWAVALRHGTSDPTLGAFWSGAFAPFPPRSISDLRWYLGRFFSVFSDPLGIPAESGGIAALALLCGAAFAFRRRRLRLLLLLLPVAFALAASAAGDYPFDGRFLLFASPLLLLVVGEGAAWIAREAPRGLTAFAIGLLFLFPVARALERLARPQTRQEIRSVLEAVRPRLLPGDALYGYRNSPAFEYYLPRLGLDPARYLAGVGRRNDWPAYARDLARLRGRRVWVVFAGIEKGDEEGVLPFFRHVLDGMGRRVESVERPGAAAFLYDLRPGAN